MTRSPTLEVGACRNSSPTLEVGVLLLKKRIKI